jgi:malate dehydrogenase (oxaloacetate-decarboxylating)
MTDPKRRSAALAERAVAEHRRWRGKIQCMPKCPVQGYEDFAVWYTPGVAAAAQAVAADPGESFELTARGDRIAIVSDGSRVLGLGDVGPLAALPVMEGKALLFKYLGAVDAAPLCIDVHDEAGIAAFVEALSPSFGGVNLEDIATPKCFRILERLQKSSTIPVWHDDQQGTAAATLAGLQNALEVVGKALGEVRVALIGIGAANYSVYRLLKAAGANPEQIIACDSRGILHKNREDIAGNREPLREKWRVCQETNPERRAGGVREALDRADVCLAFSTPGPGVISPEAVRGMARDPIVFACANPTPEIWPEDARRAGAAITATGRSDFPNQVNNALVFPGLFRGVLDVRASSIGDAVALAAATALAAQARKNGLAPDRLLPRLDDADAAAAVAGAAAGAAMAEGVAKLQLAPETVVAQTRLRIAETRAAAAALFAPKASA